MPDPNNPLSYTDPEAYIAQQTAQGIPIDPEILAKIRMMQSGGAPGGFGGGMGGINPTMRNPSTTPSQPPLSSALNRRYGR